MHPRRGAKASPGGEAVATSVATDEVEAKNYHQRKVRHCYPRPHPSRAKARDTFPSRGRLFLCPIGPYVDFCRSGIRHWRAGHAAAPTHKTYCLPPLIRLCFAKPPSPRGRLFSERARPCFLGKDPPPASRGGSFRHAFFSCFSLPYAFFSCFSRPWIFWNTMAVLAGR